MKSMNVLFRVLKAFVLSACMLYFANAAKAEPEVIIKTNYYSVSGNTAAELKDEMRRKGKNGWWGYTRWFVRWTGACRITVTINYTLPRWTDKHAAPAPLRKIWERMLANLRTHEKGHAQFGINAGREIHRSGCNGNQHAIIGKWAQQDKVYDSRTRSGFTQGVALQPPSVSLAVPR